jgi:hypothetical protein
MLQSRSLWDPNVLYVSTQETGESASSAEATRRNIKVAHVFFHNLGSKAVSGPRTVISLSSLRLHCDC